MHQRRTTVVRGRPGRFPAGRVLARGVLRVATRNDSAAARPFL